MQQSNMCLSGRFRQQVDGTTLVRTEGPAPCGVAIQHGMLNMRWRVELISSKLDANGFVLDNNAVKAHFDAMAVVDVSCELLAQRCAQHFAHQLEAQCGTGACAQVKVTIWGGDHASLEYCWP